MKPHILQPQGVIGPAELKVERRAFDAAVELHRDGAILRLLAGAGEDEGTVTAAVAIADQLDRRASEHQIAEMEDTVGRAFQPSDDTRQSPGQTAEEAIVEADHLRAAIADHPRAAPTRARHHAQPRGNVDDAEARDQIAAQRAVQADLIDAGAQIDEQADPAGQLVGAQAKVVAGERRGCHAQDAVDRQIAQDSAGDIADAGHARGGEADRERDR